MKKIFFTGLFFVSNLFGFCSIDNLIYIENEFAESSVQKVLYVNICNKVDEVIKLSSKKKLKHVKLDEEILKLYACSDYLIQRKGGKVNWRKKEIFKNKIFGSKKRRDKYALHKKVVLSAVNDFNIPSWKENKKECLALEKEIIKRKKHFK